jgi:hypothetical protein
VLKLEKLATIGLLAAVAFLPVACASQQSAPPNARAMTSPSSIAAGSMSSGKDMQTMMAQCADMRRQMQPGAAMAPNMQQMMTQCDQMDRMHSGAPQSPTR